MTTSGGCAGEYPGGRRFGGLLVAGSDSLVEGQNTWTYCQPRRDLYTD